MLRQTGVVLTLLDEIAGSPIGQLDGPNQTPALRHNDRVREALAALHAAHRFARIEFPQGGGLGFRTIQAKRAGLGFADVDLAVRPSCLAPANPWPGSAADLADDFAERYALEHADCQLSTSSEEDADVAPAPGPLPPVEEGRPLVTVSVAHYNLGAHLEETLASIARQTYPRLEVLVIDDGSTDPDSAAVFRRMRAAYPHFRFHEQPNAGIGATRNRGLALARGEYFLPMDADNVARPDMVARFVTAAERNPGVAAFTSYFLAFRDSADLAAGRFAYAYRPTGGPHVLAAMKNVYGDGNALFRTRELREVGGFEVDRDTSWEDWELFAKLARHGHRIDVVPDYLFYYRHRDAGFSRTTDRDRNHRRVLRQYVGHTVPAAERRLVWDALAGFQYRLEALEDENRGLRRRLATPRYRWADGLYAALRRAPGVLPLARYLLGGRQAGRG